jgi:membrane protein
VQEVSPETPEARAKRASVRARFGRGIEKMRPGGKAFEIGKRVALGVYADGFIHAGNLAYLALLTLFPFFIVLAALAQFFGHGPDTVLAINSFLRTVPPAVADVVRKPITDVLAARTGSLLWLGALVGLWTVGSFIETVRDILRRAYGTGYSRAFWHYRLTSAALIVFSVILALTAFSAQALLTAAEQLVYRLLPFASSWGIWIGLSRLAPLAMLAVALYGMIYSLTPSKYRMSRCPKWPGAVFTALWWMSVTMALPWALSFLGSYDRTYGGLAGTIISLFFFWLVGFGLVIGAHLNAALAETPGPSVKEAPATA